MNDKINTGGPAFPAPDLGEHDFGQRGAYWGMTLRDYFMAHAPAEPQPWFMPVMPPAPDLSVWVGESGKKYDGERAAMGSEEGLLGKVHAYCLWQNERDKQRYIQWPAAWADEMLKAREVAMPPKPAEQINADLLEALKDIAGYWNRDQNETAMADACWHAIQVADKAIAKATGEQA